MMALPASLDWIGEGLEELTIQQLSAAGQQVYSHEGRTEEMDRYGLPASGTLEPGFDAAHCAEYGRRLRRFRQTLRLTDKP